MRLAIIGAGPGGYVAALKAAQLGAQVTVVEDTEVGGTCLNRGCIPTKAMLASAEMLHKAKNLASFGIELDGTVSPNFARIIERREKVVSTQVKGVRGLFKSWGVELIEGRGVLTSPRSVKVRGRDGSEETLEADRVIVATGSRPAEIPAFPFDGNQILSSDDALALTEIPKSMIIIGAGVIGSEWGCIFSELGTEVTMVEMMPRAIMTEDEEISAVFERELKKKKIKLLTGVKVEKAERKDGLMSVELSNGKKLSAEKLLVSIGRTFNSQGIGLEEAGVRTGERGEIVVDKSMRTSAEGVYAIGDVTGGILLAHLASKEGTIAALHATGQKAEMDYGTVPAAIFTSPEIASVGLREFQAKENNIEISTGHFQFRALGKAHAMGEIAGLIKLVADKKTDRLLGAHIIGPHSSDLIHEAALAVRKGLTAADIADTIHAHPTLSEGMMEAAEDVHGKAIHMPKKQ